MTTSWFSFTPQALLNHRKWHHILCNDTYVSRLRVVAIDEVHTVINDN